jgi:putative SOS response-associated peptidase YedK
MCGRYTLSSTPESIEAIFDGPVAIPDITPRYNIAPTQVCGIVTSHGSYVFKTATWGIIPTWMREPRTLINARSETILEKPSFKRLYEAGRCVIPADGFFEWETVSGKKRPVYFHKPGREPFAFAGLFEKDPLGGPSKFVVLTVSANDFVRPVHDRMPAILYGSAIGDWIKKGDCAVLEPTSDDFLVADRVSKLVNSPSNDGPECILAADEDDSDPQLSFGF